jgi:hypothetical protein
VLTAHSARAALDDLRNSSDQPRGARRLWICGQRQRVATFPQAQQQQSIKLNILEKSVSGTLDAGH